MLLFADTFNENRKLCGGSHFIIWEVLKDPDQEKPLKMKECLEVRTWLKFSLIYFQG